MSEQIYIPPPAYEKKEPISNISHSIDMFNDPSDPYLREPSVCCGMFSALSLFKALTLFTFFLMIPFFMTAPIEIFLILTVLSFFQLLMYLSIHYGLDRPLTIFYPLDFIWWTLVAAYTFYAVNYHLTHNKTVPMDIYWLMMLSLSGLYRNLLAATLLKWIRKCNQELVLMTAYRGMERGSF